MRRFKKVFNSRVLIADGAMGTLLQEKLPVGVVPDEINLSSPQTVAAIHREYARSGADVLTSNTFGASPLKLQQSGLEKKFRSINSEAMRLVREVADREGCWVAGDIGPSGRLIEPLGDLGFAAAAASFGAQARALQRGGADFILLETISDIQEFRAALVGILANVTIPVLAGMSFSANGVSLSGSDGNVFAVTSDFIGLLAVGANCGSSLEDTRLAMELIARYSPKPIFCQPNAGIPRQHGGTTVFDVTPLQFAEFMADMVGLGVALIGSCCGSTPEFTRELARRFKNLPVRPRAVPKRDRRSVIPGAGDQPLRLRLATRTRVSEPQPGRIFLVGERINPSNRPKLRRELEQGRLTTARFDAREQARAGADALDLNLNTAGGLADATVAAVCQGVQHAADLPLFMDTTDPQRVEIFAQNFAGKGVINSISGEAKSLRRLLPLARKYNLALIASLLDEGGIPATVADRLRIARRIMTATARLKIPSHDVIFDPLVLSAAAESDKAAVTLETIAALKSEFPNNRVIIGLSNISYGLPSRPLLNAVFLGLAASRGLDMVIANPLDETLRQQLQAINLLANATPKNLSTFIATQGPITRAEDRVHQGSPSLSENIIEGDIDSARQNLARLLTAANPLGLIENHIIPAMNEVGRRYQSGEFFLPQLIAAAEVVKAILPAIKQRLGTAAGDQPTRVTLATVKGDIHDIGKNIVASILESYNFSVHDLGRDVAPEKIVASAIAGGADVIGLSSLMTTTLPAMFRTIELIRANRELQRVRVFIGGAVVNAEIATQHRVDYAQDGLEMAKRIKNNVTGGMK